MQFIENRNSDRSLSTVAQSLRAARMEFDIRTGQSVLPPVYTPTLGSTQIPIGGLFQANKAAEAWR